MPAPDAAKVAHTYYLIAGLYTLSASLIWGINTIFLLDAGLTLLQVFIANAIFTGSMAMFEVPTGIVADIRGRRLSFLISVAILLAGTVAYAAAPALGGGFGAFAAVSILLGLGYTFYSGAVEAWVVDALGAAGYADPIDRVLARGGVITSVAILVGTVTGGVLAGVHLTLPYVIRCLLLVAVFLYAWRAMHDVGYATRAMSWRAVPAEMARVGRESVRFGWKMPRARLAILAGAVPAVFLEWGYHAWQPHFLDLLGRDATWVLGVIAASVALAQATGNWMVERLTRFCGRRTTILLGASLVYAVASAAVGIADSFAVAAGLYLAGMMSAGVFQPVRQAYLHLVVPREQRATVLSLASLVASGGSMAGQAGLGWLAVRTSLAGGYLVGGAVTILAIPFLLRMRALGGGPDRIVGKAGRYATCPTLALPEGVAVAAARDLDAARATPAPAPAYPPVTKSSSS